MYGDKAVSATSKFVKTKLRLMPYLYAQVRIGAEDPLAPIC